MQTLPHARRCGGHCRCERSNRLLLWGVTPPWPAVGAGVESGGDGTMRRGTSARYKYSAAVAAEATRLCSSCTAEDAATAWSSGWRAMVRLAAAWQGSPHPAHTPHLAGATHGKTQRDPARPSVKRGRKGTCARASPPYEAAVSHPWQPSWPPSRPSSPSRGRVSRPSPADAGSLPRNTSPPSMSFPCRLVGCGAVAVRPRPSSSQLAALRLCASILALRSTPSGSRPYNATPAAPPQLHARVLSLTSPRPLSLQKQARRLPPTAVARYASVASEPHDEESPTSPPFTAGPYATLTIGIPKESYPGERRVAITPQNVKLLLKKGFSRILIERGAGLEAQFTDEAYEQAGAKTVDRRSVFSESDILLKVRALSIDGPDSEVDAIREGATVISFLYPLQNKPIVDRLSSRKATAFAMDMVPRISRAQVFDALRYHGAFLFPRAQS